ncbi:MAG: hypothetical protein GY777_08110 [Candidatus Brocadiaceae bacterium]|nr:hypothetical protein [Candidatus Brocadiaceae bacterium]
MKKINNEKNDENRSKHQKMMPNSNCSMFASMLGCTNPASTTTYILVYNEIKASPKIYRKHKIDEKSIIKKMMKNHEKT